MLTNVSVATTVTLMIPVQTVTVDEPDGSLERDLIVRAVNNPDLRRAGAHDNAAARSASHCLNPQTITDDNAAARSASHCLNPLANTDDFGQPAPDPVSYTHLRAHETRHDLVCRLLL